MATDDVSKAIATCNYTQDIINLTAKHLDGLRTRCATTEEITQNAIKESEVKIIKQFSKQLVTKAAFKQDNLPPDLQKYPNTEQWLKIVGVQETARQQMLARKLCLETLLEMSPEQVASLVRRYGAKTEEINNLVAALKNLKTWTDLQTAGETQDFLNMELHWSTYKSASNSPYAGNSPKLPLRPSTSSLPADAVPTAESPQSPSTPTSRSPASPLPQQSPQGEHRCYTPPPTPLVSKPMKGKFPTTPPPNTRNKLHLDSPYPLIKSTSHESQLANKIVDVDNIGKYLQKKPDNLTLSHEQIYNKRRKSADSAEDRAKRAHSGQMSPLIGSSPKRSPPYQNLEQNSFSDFEVHSKKKFNTVKDGNQLMVPPVSPRAVTVNHPGFCSMGHYINHRFQTRLVWAPCDLCQKKVTMGKLCKYCKLKFHKDCAAKAAPACGLPQQYLDYYIEHTMNDSPHSLRRGTHDNTMSLPGHHEMGHIRPANSVPAFQAPDSSSNTSSCNSSTPSSPALVITSSGTMPPMSPSQRSPHIQVTHELDPPTQFTFPDPSSTGTHQFMTGVADSLPALGTDFVSLDTGQSINNIDVVNTNTSNDSDKSDKTLIDSNQSGGSTLLERGDSQDPEDLGHNWQRGASISLKEWDIPFEELQKGDKIGEGRFGTVYKGNWHGDVAIKMLNMDPDQDNQAQLVAFKQEVSMLKKTRHENLVLFMGACMKPPHLAIVTSLCKGETLYKRLHGERFQFNKIVIVASQIAQGMGYLHAKGILHKDLKSKNVFLEAGRVVITDFGLCNVTKMCHGERKREWLPIPKGWLCYLAPEIIRSLQPGGNYMRDMDLPFSEASDVYAFGTVWYELLTGEWPFRAMHAETIIWQVGCGIKQSLSNIHASRDVKDLLMMCWSYEPEARPSFGSLLKALTKLPKKRLARSPSHPVQLSRSAESVI